MHSQYDYVLMAETGGEAHRFDVLVSYGIFERIFGAIIISLIFTVISLVLAVSIPDTLLPIIFKVALIGVSIFIASLLFWYVAVNGLFVIGANRKGIYYRDRSNPKRLIFLPWNNIKEVSMYEDGAKELVIKTYIQDALRLPKPCNGTSFVQDGTAIVSVYLGFFKDARKILGELRALKVAS